MHLPASSSESGAMPKNNSRRMVDCSDRCAATCPDPCKRRSLAPEQESGARLIFSNKGDFFPDTLLRVLGELALAEIDKIVTSLLLLEMKVLQHLSFPLTHTSLSR